MSKALFSKIDYNGLFNIWQSNNSEYVIVPEEYRYGKAYLVFESIEDVRNRWTPVQRCYSLKEARKFVLEKEKKVM